MWKDSETTTDYLDYDYLVHILNSIILNKELAPSTIGVYGDWGSGKSSLLRISKDRLSKDPKVICIPFNAWLFESYDDAKAALMNTILDNLRDNLTLTAKGKQLLENLYSNVDFLKLASKGVKYGLDFLLTGGVGTLSDIGVNTIRSIVKTVAKNKIDGISEADLESSIKASIDSKDVRSTIKSFHTDFEALLEDTKLNNVVIYIDELDRCNPETILDILEAIRLFLFTSKTSFVIGADERHISYAVKRKFESIEGNQIDIGKEYLEKLIQYPIRIPRLNQSNVEHYIIYLFMQLHLNATNLNIVLDKLSETKEKDFLNFTIDFEAIQLIDPVIANKVKKDINLAKQISSVLSSGLNGNPRQCKRFLNTLMMRMEMAKFRGAELSIEVLSKLMMLEYFKTDFFRKLSSLQHANEGKPIEITQIEANEWNNVKTLILWKDDQWILDFLKKEPFLSDIDLRPYFYFVRESITANISVGMKLSDIANDTLKKLLSGSQVNRDLVIKSSENVNDAEANIILEELKSKCTSSTGIDNNLFKSLAAWGACKESLHTSTISFMAGINAKDVKFGHIPTFQKFMEDTKKESVVMELLTKIKEENPSVKAAIEAIKVVKGV